MLSFACRAPSLNKAITKDQSTQFGRLDKRDSTAVAVKEKDSISPLVLTVPNNNGLQTMDTNVCYQQIGCVAVQEENDNSSLSVRYRSRTLNNKK